MSANLTIDFHRPMLASTNEFETFKTLKVASASGTVTFYFRHDADVKTIADAFNAVIAPAPVASGNPA